MALIIKLDSIVIKNPTTPIQISQYPITAHVGRVSSGLMTMSYVTDKKSFQFDYEAIKANDLTTILDIIYDFPTMFHTLNINENGVAADYTVYPGAVTKNILRSDENGYWYWSDVSFQLIER